MHVYVLLVVSIKNCECMSMLRGLLVLNMIGLRSCFKVLEIFPPMPIKLFYISIEL